MFHFVPSWNLSFVFFFRFGEAVVLVSMQIPLASFFHQAFVVDETY